MATKAGPRKGTSSSKTSAARRRAPAKPVIIDVEADKAAEPSNTPQAPTKPAAAAATPTASGLDEATARAAGLSASARPAKAADTKSADTSAAGTKADQGAGDQAERKQPDAVSPAAGAAATPRPFVLAAAGFIGALGALALMFLAQTLGLVNAPSGQLDEQRSALLALEQQVDQRFAALNTEPVEPVQVDLAPLETDLADLRNELTQLSASLADDAGPIDLDAVLADALTPLDERIAAIEAVIQFPALPGDAAGDANDPLAAPDLQELDDLRALLASASDDIAALRADLGTLRSEFDALSSAEDPNADQITRLDARLDQMSTDMAGRLEALSGRVGELGDGLAVMGDALNAFEQAPVALAPDQLARLGLALDGLAAARDNGENLGDALGAAQAASAFDADLSGTLAPLAGLTVVDGLDDAGLLARYELAAGAMLAAAPVSSQEGGGLLDALGERARQMVTIRTPDDSTGATPGTVTGQIDRLGGLVASRQYEAALAAMDGLPDAVKTSGSDLQAALAARVTLDIALTQARHGLLAALASSNP